MWAGKGNQVKKGEKNKKETIGEKCERGENGGGIQRSWAEGESKWEQRIAASKDEMPGKKKKEGWGGGWGRAWGSGRKVGERKLTENVKRRRKQKGKERDRGAGLLIEWTDKGWKPPSAGQWGCARITRHLPRIHSVRWVPSIPFISAAARSRSIRERKGPRGHSTAVSHICGRSENTRIDKTKDTQKAAQVVRRHPPPPKKNPFFPPTPVKPHTPERKWTEQSGHPSHRIRTDHRSHSAAWPAFDFSLGKAARSAWQEKKGRRHPRQRASWGTLERNGFYVFGWSRRFLEWISLWNVKNLTQKRSGFRGKCTSLEFISPPRTSRKPCRGVRQISFLLPDMQTTEPRNAFICAHTFDHKKWCKQDECFLLFFNRRLQTEGWKC